MLTIKAPIESLINDQFIKGKSMQVTVKLFAHFRNNRFKAEVRPVAAGTTVGKIVSELGIDPEEVGVVLINARHGSLDQALAEGDILSLFPLVGGG